MGWSGEEGKHYPSPLASHEDVVKDPTLFWDTLRRFHFLMRTKFMIPVIGGKELDLHVLYVEVTRRSGYEKVVVEKKWREVGNVFRFSPTTTSASFVLRKHYSSLLYHYEQVHFFKARGPLCTPSAAAFSVSNQLWRPELAIVEYSPQRINECPESHDEDDWCGEVKGMIEGKFECGYLVSVKVGTEVLRGVLYHPEQSVSSQNGNAIVAYNGKGGGVGVRGRRRRRNRRRWDPNYPKPNRSGYNFFFAEKHYKLKALYPNREREFTKMIGQSWSSLSPEERMVYQNIGLRDKERYKRELREYKERMRLFGKPFFPTVHVAKVADFGVARVEDQSGIIMTSETGTYRWMAPEVIEHKPYDHKLGVFSFGITLWEPLTGKGLRSKIRRHTHLMLVELIKMLAPTPFFETRILRNSAPFLPECM